MDLPEVTEVRRLTLNPGDRIVVHVDAILDPRTAEDLRHRVRQQLRLSDDVAVLVLDRGASMITIDGELSAGNASQIRELVRAAHANPGRVATLRQDGSVAVTDIGDL